MKNKLLAFMTLIVVCSINAQDKITTSFGDFKIDSVGDALYKTQSYELNGKPVGKSEWIDVDGKLLGMSKGANYIVVRGFVGGSGCSEVLSIVKITESQAEFSPALNACGGVDSVDFDNGVVTVSAFERDGSTKVQYVIDGNRILENGKSMLVKHDFLMSH